MKERPIIFSQGMIKALLNGTKTMTRRISGKPLQWLNQHPDKWFPAHYHDNLHGVYRTTFAHRTSPRTVACDCPHGKVGDRLWVRESWQAWTQYNDTAPNDLPHEMRQRINYPADGNTWDALKRNAMFMPRWASRLTLEIIDIRVERLNEISEEDAQAEGIQPNWCGDLAGWSAEEHGFLPHDGDSPLFDEYERLTAKRCFEHLWDSINGAKYPWQSNCWVWVIEFKQVQL